MTYTDQINELRKKVAIERAKVALASELDRYVLAQTNMRLIDKCVKRQRTIDLLKQQSGCR